MIQNGPPWRVRAAALAITALPVCFGVLRAITTGTDFRYLVTALASLAVAAMVFWLGASRTPARWLLAVVSMGASTLIAGIVAFAQGAKSAGGVATVALSFGLCVTAGGMLGLYDRLTSTQ